MFRIGEFSKIAQVSGRLLRYYDEIGLLKPIRIDKFTGYRYYSAEQLPRLNRILALKELGLSLEQVSRLLNDDLSANEIRGMLTLKKAEIEQEMLDEMRRIRTIEARLHQIEAEGSMNRLDVVLKSLPAQTILSFRDTFSGDGSDWDVWHEMLATLPKQLGNQFQYMIGIMHSEMFEADDYDMELGCILATRKSPKSIILKTGHELKMRDVPPIETVATFIIKNQQEGDYQLGYSAIGIWAESNGYQLTGAGREVILHIADADNPDDTMITEIQYPVQKVDVDLLSSPL